MLVMIRTSRGGLSPSCGPRGALRAWPGAYPRWVSCAGALTRKALTIDDESFMDSLPDDSLTTSHRYIEKQPSSVHHPQFAGECDFLAFAGSRPVIDVDMGADRRFL